MAFFNTKTDPAVKQQRDLENQLKAKRASRDDLIQRRQAAEAGAAAHRDKAVMLAAEAATDAELSAAETAMRREQDRIATLSDAITKTGMTIAELEAQIAQIVDHRCRVETAAAVNELVKNWATSSAAFNAAVGQLVELARESTIIVGDALLLKNFLEKLAVEVPPEIAHVSRVLEDHAKAVLDGRAPASLPKPAAPVPAKVIERPVTERWFAMKVVKWVDAQGVQKVADQFTFAELTPSAAINAKRCHAVISQGDPRCRELHGAQGGRHPSVATALDLDDEAACQPPQIDPVLAAANFQVTVGPAITGVIPMRARA